MLLRWLVNQYLREAGEQKVREVVSDLTRRALPGNPAGEPPANRAPQGEAPEPSSALAKSRSAPQPGEEFLPCHAVFVFALGIESGGLVDLLQGAETSRLAHGTERAGQLAGREVAIVESGVGQRAAARATADAIKFYQPKWVISAGFAGGLTENLRRGHILVADEIVSASDKKISVTMPLDPASIAATKGLHVGRLLTVDAILREPAERRRLAEQHSAIACDMEAFAVATACQQHNVPCLAIRVISDAVDDELPPEIEHLLRQKSLAGKLGAAAAAVLKRFSAAKDLWKLRDDALKSSDRLAKFLAGICTQL